MPHIADHDIDPELRTVGKIIRRLPSTNTPRWFRLNNWYANRHKKGHFPDHLHVEERYIPRSDNTQLRVLVAWPDNPQPLATGVLWLYGGGYAVGLPETDLRYAEKITAITNSVMIFPDYRRSTEAPYPAGLNDAYTALEWMLKEADALGINPNQLFVAGESAGGGLAAALSLYVRDHSSIKIAFQMPLYPMLDDRPTSSSADNDAPVWNTRSNRIAWSLYLGDYYGTDQVPPYAAPARAADYAGLPPTYSFVGTIEPFYAEVLTYIRNLQDAGVTARADVYPGAFHAFDLMLPNATISQEATRNWLNAFRFATDHYFAKNT